MNATTYPQPSLHFIAVSRPAHPLIVARPTPPAPAIVAVTAVAEGDAPEAAAVRCQRPPRDNLARYGAPAVPALFHVC